MTQDGLILLMRTLLLILVSSQVTTVVVGLLYIRTLKSRADNLRKDAEFFREKYDRLVQYIVNTFSPK